MPESKLAEKLGFQIRNGYKIVDRRTFKATDAEIALWNLCLELSEHVEELEQSRNPRITMQTLSDSGVNPFAVKLLAESFTRKKDFAEWFGTVGFVFDGIEMIFRKPALAEKEKKA